MYEQRQETTDAGSQLLSLSHSVQIHQLIIVSSHNSSETEKNRMREILVLSRDHRSVTICCVQLSKK